MYISVPKNYSGSAFAAQNGKPADPMVTPVGDTQVPPPPPAREAHHTLPANVETKEMQIQSAEAPEPPQTKKPLTAFLEAVRKRQENGISGDDLLLMGLISLLAGKEENSDIVGILTLLLLL